MPFGRTSVIEPPSWVSATECFCAENREVLDFCNRHGRSRRQRRRTRFGAAPETDTPESDGFYLMFTSSYCLVYSPISSAWVTWDSQFVSGWTCVNLSPVSKWTSARMLP